MKDIKTIKSKSSVVVDKQKVITENIQSVNKKSEINFSYFLFGFMSLSVLVYVFFVSSTFYFAIKERQAILSINNINNTQLVNVVEENKKFLVGQQAKNNNVSYINTKDDTSISLK